jgi:hypothetical protein
MPRSPKQYPCSRSQLPRYRPQHPHSRPPFSPSRYPFYTLMFYVTALPDHFHPLKHFPIPRRPKRRAYRHRDTRLSSVAPCLHNIIPSTDLYTISSACTYMWAPYLTRGRLDYTSTHRRFLTLRSDLSQSGWNPCLGCPGCAGVSTIVPCVRSCSTYVRSCIHQSTYVRSCSTYVRSCSTYVRSCIHYSTYVRSCSKSVDINPFSITAPLIASQMPNWWALVTQVGGSCMIELVATRDSQLFSQDVFPNSNGILMY